MSEKIPWDADCDATRVGLERFMRALVVTHSHFSDSFTLASVVKPGRVTVFFRVWIPEGEEQAFMKLACIDEMKPPPRVALGMEPLPEPARMKVTRLR